MWSTTRQNYLPLPNKMVDSNTNGSERNNFHTIEIRIQNTERQTKKMVQTESRKMRMEERKKHGQHWIREISNENGLKRQGFIAEMLKHTAGDSLELCVYNKALETQWQTQIKTIWRKCTQTNKHMDSTNKEIRKYKIRSSDSSNNNRYCITHQTKYTMS